MLYQVAGIGLEENDGLDKLLGHVLSVTREKRGDCDRAETVLNRDIDA